MEQQVVSDLEMPDMTWFNIVEHIQRIKNDVSKMVEYEDTYLYSPWKQKPSLKPQTKDSLKKV
jgi:hypothetical protein